MNIDYTENNQDTIYFIIYLLCTPSQIQLKCEVNKMEYISLLHHFSELLMCMGMSSENTQS